MKIKVTIIALTIGLFTITSVNAQAEKQHTNMTEQVIKDTFTCPMHPEEMQNKPGSCSKCGMDLQKVTAGKTAKSSSCCPSSSESKQKSHKAKSSCGMSKSNKKTADCKMKKEMKSKENHKGHKQQ